MSRYEHGKRIEEQFDTVLGGDTYSNDDDSYIVTINNEYNTDTKASLILSRAEVKLFKESLFSVNGRQPRNN